jgi:spermidine synthase
MLQLRILFFASGCAALIYEMVWFYLVQLIVGASSISVAVLLCSFMGGMALGSWLLPKLAPATVHPLRLLAMLEAGMALLGMAIPFALPFIQQTYAAVAGYGPGPLLLRAVVCMLVLTPPTMLMGATLPAIARWRVSGRGTDFVGVLYMANLAGAATGTVLAGFFLLRVFDTFTASAVAVALNSAVAAACWWLAARAPVALDSLEASAFARADSGERRREAAIGRGRRRAIYVVAALSGLTALGAEVVWTRQLSLLFGASVYTFSLILAVFLAGLGLGGHVGSMLARRYSDVRLALGVVQMLLVIAIAFGAWAIVHALPLWQPTSTFLPGVRATPGLAFAFDALRCTVAMLPATLLWGASFPLMLAAPATDFSRHVARVNATNTVGALFGAIAITVVGIPEFGSQVSQQAIMLLAAVSAAIVLWPSASRLHLLPATAVLALTGLLVVPAVPASLIAYGRSVNSWDSIKQVLYLAEGSTASVAVTEGVAGAKQFHIAGKVEASDMDLDMRLERMLGHVPALLHPNPKSILIVGVGAGVTAGALSIHPEVERIVICEIEPVVPASARRYFGKENHHVLEDPRVELILDDARHFLLTTDERFDIITSDPIHPWVRGAATLYSLEYLQLVRDHLNPGGIVTQWIPLYETDARSVKSEIATFVRVFPNTTLWNPDLLEEGYDLVALGTVEAAPISETAIARRLEASEAVQRSLADVALKSSGSILATYAGRRQDLAPWLVDAEINRERHLRLQYMAGLAANTDQRFLIFQSLLNYRRYPADLFEVSAGLEAQLRAWYAP